MTKIYKATPVKRAEPERLGGKPYLISPEAMAIKPMSIMEESPIAGRSELGGAKYLTDAGSEFSFELNILDTASKLPIRGVEIKIGDKKAFTDRVGRAVFRLPFGKNKISVPGAGFVENGSYAPKPVQFEPLILELDLTDDAIYTLYSTGELIPGERRQMGNPGHGSINIQEFIEENWQVLALASGGAIGAFFLGRRKKD